jgi:hypothetical protein
MQLPSLDRRYGLIQKTSPSRKGRALFAVACAATCLGLAQASRRGGPAHAPAVAVPSIPLSAIPTDHYLDLGAPAPRAAADQVYTPAGASWGRPEPPFGPWAPESSERRYEDLGR